MDSNFIPMILAEDKAPPESKDYLQCEVCTPRSRIIWGEGNPKAPIFVILDNPGARENREGKEYVCGTRETFQSVIHYVNLTVNDVYVTYLLKCRPLGSYNKEEVRSFSRPFLENQIKSAEPKIIVCLGDVVVQSMFDNSKANVKNLRGTWHYLMGYPTVVAYHPLAVRRRPNLMNLYIQDWEMVAQRFENII